MSNMTYCMFRNTKNDLTDCLDKLQQDNGQVCSQGELEAAEEMMQICREILEWEYKLSTEEEEEEGKIE